jgi:hypothetical protein
MNPNLPGHADCGGIVLAEAMTPSELREFDESGAHPACRRACILCSRFVTTDAYLFVNKTYAVPSNVLLNWRGLPLLACVAGSAGLGGRNPHSTPIPAAGTPTPWTVRTATRRGSASR